MEACIRSLHHKNLTAILNALADKSQSKVAGLIGVSETNVSRYKSELDQLAALLAACDLAVVPTSFKVVPPDRLKALEILALEALHNVASAGGWEK